MKVLGRAGISSDVEEDYAQGLAFQRAADDAGPTGLGLGTVDH